MHEVYSLFFKKFPTLKELYVADEAELREIIRPLGLEIVRATILKRLAGELAKHHGGTVPCDEEQLLQLPGVGRYAANATRCFAFGKRAALVDVNVIRVINRVFGVTSKKPRARDDPLIWSFVEEHLLPLKNFESFNLALLDFAATICRKRIPKCGICFATSYCAYFQRLASGQDGSQEGS